MSNKCVNCSEKCLQAELAHNASLGRMYAMEELVPLLKKIESGELAPVVRGRWQWVEVWNPSTPDNPRECESAVWMCGMCKTTLEDMVGGYWDNPDEEPNLNYCPNCGAKMDLRENIDVKTG